MQATMKASWPEVSSTLLDGTYGTVSQGWLCPSVLLAVFLSDIPELFLSQVLNVISQGHSRITGLFYPLLHPS
jgi:hypothetical protein